MTPPIDSPIVYEVLWREKHSTTIESETIELHPDFANDEEWYRQAVACERALDEICEQYDYELEDINLIGAVRV